MNHLNSKMYVGFVMIGDGMIFFGQINQDTINVNRMI